MMRDEDDDKEQILKMLGGEVDDYAGSKLKDPDAPEGEPNTSKGPGVTIEVSVKPHGKPEPKEGGDEDDPAAPDVPEDSEHDPIAHILGMCNGVCPKE